MAHASAADLAARFDARILADLASDTGEPVADLSSDPIIQAALDDASGRLESAVTVARHYSSDDLDELTDNSLALLKRITCQLAMVFLLNRRQENLGDERLQKVADEAEDFLERLRKGERLFGVEANLDAGLPETDGPTTTQYRNMNLIPDRTRNFFPERATRLPIGRY